MSKTSEKADWVSRRVVIGLLALFSALAACASVDQPDATKLSGNAYHDGGWISYRTDINKENGYLQFDSGDDYVYSTRYAAPIRKIVMETRCSSSSTPTRFLTVMPYVQGVEAPALAVTNAAYAGKDKLAVAAFDFSTSVGVDAFRLGMTGGTGNWGVTRIAVFYGTKTDDEDALLREFAQQLPTPENLRLEGLAASSLSLAASPVDDASGYCFELTKLTGCPRTEIREDFVSAPNLSNGWTFGETNNVKLTSYSGDGSSYVDKDNSEDRTALKIERRNTTDPVCVEILSPVTPAGEVLRECSYWSKCSAAGSDKIEVYGQAGGSGEWESLADEHTVTTAKDRQTIYLTAEQNVSRIKFVFRADGETCKSCALDSLCAVYGGDEARELVSAQTNETPEASWKDLATGRYGCRVKALGATGGEEQFKDSAWTEEQTVDLAWADVRLSPPENLAFEVSGDKLNLSWTPVAMADHYEVKVALADDPENPVVTLVTKSVSASVQLAELGDYVVTVTAVSPGGVSTATSSLENCTVALGKVTGLAVEATAADTIAATWNAVPLAESYQAKLFKVTGEAGTEVSDYSNLTEGEWPAGWEHSPNWLPANLTTTGPKFTYTGEWIETKSLSLGITRVTFVTKSNSSSADKLANQHLQVEAYSEKDGSWSVCADVDVVSTSQTTEELTFEISDDVRRLRFTAFTRDGNYAPAIQLGKVSVSYGAYVRTEVASAGTKECTATYRGLDRMAKYVVVVTPQPSEGTECEASSVVVDLASEYFRPVGPMSVAGLRGGVYLQRFDALAGVTKETDLRRVPLENWQFFKGSGEAEKLYYTSGTNSTTGGVYCYSDAERTANSFMIGTVATGTTGSSVGLAFVNDTGTALGAPTLTFTAVRRNEKPGDPYALEWLVTDGPWSIGTESDGWRPLQVAEGEPEFSVMPDCRLGPGQVIVFRWRQEKVKGGPMLGLDDVHVEFPVDKPGFGVYVR